jgi:AcrR family transcriptional regulator
VAAQQKRGKVRNSDTPERIVDAAEHLIGLHGYDGLRLRDIANTVSIQIPSIYGHFDGREAVRAAVGERYVAGLCEQFRYDGSSDPEEAIVSGTRQLVKHLAMHPGYTRLKLRDLEVPGGMPELNRACEGDALHNLTTGPLKDLFDRVSTILQRGHEQDNFRKVGFIPFWRMLMGTTLVSLTWPNQEALHRRPSQQALDRITREVEDAVLRYLRPD